MYRKFFLLIATAAFFGGCSFIPINTFQVAVTSRGMEPTLPYDSTQLARKIDPNNWRKVQRQDIIVYEFPENNEKGMQPGKYVRRLIGFPGDEVQLIQRRHDVQTYVNGKLLEEPYVEENKVSLEYDSGKIKVDSDKVFVLADDRTTYPPIFYQIPVNNIVGVLIKK